MPVAGVNSGNQNSEELNRKLLDHLPCIAMLMKRGSYEVVACNKDAREAKVAEGSRCYEAWKGFSAPCPWCLASEVWKSGEGRNLIIEHKGETMDTYWVPVDEDHFLHYAFDITMRYEFQKNLVKSRESERRLRILSRRFIELREEERASLARELHDDLAQRMTALSIELDLLLGTAEGEQRDQISRIFSYCNETIAGLRMLCRSLRPMLIDDIGLVPAIKTLCRDYAAKTGMTIETEISKSEICDKCTLDGMHVYRIVQEALENAHKHGGAVDAKLTYKCNGARCSIKVTDSGAGFDLAETNISAGMIAMNERAEMLGGDLVVTSIPGRGTTVSLEIPCGGGGR